MPKKLNKSIKIKARLTRNVNLAAVLAVGLSAGSADAGLLGALLGSTIPIPTPPQVTTPLPNHPWIKELNAEIEGPKLAALIKLAKADAQKGELRPLPENVKTSLSTYFPAHILDKIRWRTGGGELTLQTASINLGGKAAITLDDIIVFQDSGLINNLHLVAHEVAHVVQYHEWGITKFSKRYVKNYNAVENAAEQKANAWELTRTDVPLASIKPKQVVPRPHFEPCQISEKYHCF